MNKKISFFVALLVLTSLTGGSCSPIVGGGLGGGIPGSGAVVTETRDTGTFDAISIEYPGAEISVQQGKEETVAIEADDNLLPQLSTEVLSGTLIVKSTETEWKTSVAPSTPVKINITVRDLNMLVLPAPVADLELNDLQTGMLKLVVSGGARVRLNAIRVEVLDAVLSGAGAIEASGLAEEVRLVLSGLGDFNAADLASKKADIQLSGMGDATVWVEDELAATISGAGSIQYFGHPHVEQTVNGAGSVKPAE